MKALILLAKGFEEIEATTVYDVLSRAAVEVTLASIDRDALVVGAHGLAMKTSIYAGDVANTRFDAVVLPGGMPGAQNLRESSIVRDILHNAVAREATVGAICAAPMVLGSLGLLTGHKATCYPGFEHYLEGAQIIEDPVVLSGNFLTSRGPATAMAFALALVKRLKGDAMSDRLARDLLSA